MTGPGETCRAEHHPAAITAEEVGDAAPIVARPLVWWCVAFVVGVGVGGQPWRWTGLALGLALSLGGSVRRPWRWLAVGVALAFALGVWRTSSALAAWEHHPLRAWLDRPTSLEGAVTEPPAPRRAGGESVTLALTRPVTACVRINFAGRAPVAAGDRVRLTATLRRPAGAGNPGQFSHRRKLQRDGHHALCDAGGGDVTVLARGRAATLQRVSRALRARLCGVVRAAMPTPCAGHYADLLNGLVFGVYAAPVDPPVDAAFRRAGLSHLLVASGTQVSLLMALAWATTRLLPLPLWAASLWALALVGAYVLVTGPEPSILRAALMGLVLLVSVVWDRDYDWHTALAVAAVLLLAANPLKLGHVGLQLSFAATAGVVLLGKPLAERWQARLGAVLAGTAAFTLGAQLFVAPLMIYHFHRLPLIGLLANLPAVPLAALVVPLGLGAAVCGVLSPGLAAVVCAPLHALLGVLVAAVGALSRVSWACLENVVVTPLGYGLMVVGLAALCVLAAPRAAQRWARWWTRERLVLSGALLLATWLGLAAWSAAHAGLELFVFDVGEGDAMLLRGPTGRTLLVDAGPRSPGGDDRDAGSERVVPALMLLGVRRLGGAVATHEHIDHIGGLPSVLRAYPRTPVYAARPALDSGATAVDDLRDATRRAGASLATVARGQVFDLGGGARVEVLWPPTGWTAGGKSAANNTSVVLRATYGQTAFLLAGDLEASGEQRLLTQSRDLRADVLKVPHQGSAGSTTPELLRAVAPRLAVISVGRNQFGHPAPRTLERLRAGGAEVRRTDRDGMVTYHSNGHSVRVRCYGQR